MFLGSAQRRTLPDCIFSERCTAPSDGLPANGKGWVTFLSPWIDGATLEQFLADGSPIDPPLVAEIAEQMFSAVLELERANLRHDDLHTGNVLLSEVQSLGGSPHAPTQVKVCIVDTGGIKASQEVGQHKPFTDLTNFANALAQLHDAVWRDTFLIQKLCSTPSMHSRILWRLGGQTRQTSDHSKRCLLSIWQAIRYLHRCSSPSSSCTKISQIRSPRFSKGHEGAANR